MNSIMLESLELDYGKEEVAVALQKSKKYFHQFGHYDLGAAVTEYGGYDELILASLLHTVTSTGGLEEYSNSVYDFVNVLRSETKKLESTVRLDAYPTMLDTIYPPALSAEDSYTTNGPDLGDGADPLHYNSNALGGIKPDDTPGFGVNLGRLTKKQREALEVFANTRSKVETARLLRTSVASVKQLLQRARKALK